MFVRKSGSSLLLTVLLLAGISLLVLAGSRVILEGTRTAAQTNAFHIARDTAMSGIQEGLLLYNKNLLLDGEYGDPLPADGQYHLKPVRRGFVQNTTPPCTQFVAADQPAATATSYDKSCPYYDFSIRNTVALTSTAVTYNLTTRELPNNIAVVLPIKHNVAGINMYLNSVPGLTYDYRLCTTYDCSDVPTKVLGNTNLVFQIPGGKKGVELTFHYTPPTNHVVLIYQVRPVAGLAADGTTFLEKIAIGKGYTTIDSTGYTGGEKKKVRMVIRKNDTVTPVSPVQPITFNILDAIDSFDQFGILN